MIKVKKAGNSGFGKTKIILPLAAALLGGACASFHSGDILLERSTLKTLMEDKTIKPFSKIQVSWQNYPFRNPTDSIGEGSISNPPKFEPVPAESEDLEYFRRKAKYILADAGLYDPKNGSGTLKLDLTTSGRWTYRDLFKSYLVDTFLIFILPSSIKTSFAMTAEFKTSSGTLRTEIVAYNKTTFHLLLAPFYPLFSPGAKGKSLIRQMLWRTTAEIYEKIKNPEYEKEVRRAAPAAGPSENAQRAPGGAPKEAGWTQEDQSPAGPPEPPDRTWTIPVPQETAPESEEETAPQGEIKPDPPARTWIPKTVPAPAKKIAPDADQSGD